MKEQIMKENEEKTKRAIAEALDELFISTGKKPNTYVLHPYWAKDMHDATDVIFRIIQSYNTGE